LSVALLRSKSGRKLGLPVATAAARQTTKPARPRRRTREPATASAIGIHLRAPASPLAHRAVASASLRQAHPGAPLLGPPAELRRTLRAQPVSSGSASTPRSDPPTALFPPAQ